MSAIGSIEVRKRCFKKKNIDQIHTLQPFASTLTLLGHLKRFNIEKKQFQKSRQILFVVSTKMAAIGDVIIFYHVVAIEV